MLDNVADLLLTVGLLSAIFGFPVEFAIGHMVPGTALGVLCGDLAFFWMALRLAKQAKRPTVTAMPLGLDTPSTFGMVFFVLGPAFLAAKETMSVEAAARFTWHIGICSIVISGLFKLACAAFSGWIRRVVPRAGLLGSLVAIALVLISFLPLIEIFHYPLVGMVALAIILTTLVAKIPFPGRTPGTLAALIVAGGMYYLLQWGGYQQWLGPEVNLEIDPRAALFPVKWLSVFRFEWLSALPAAMQYMPIVIPFALATVIGGIDCTESAAAAGDEFDTNAVIGVEALATLIAGLCGGVIQTTPYIGHPAYKAMGGRSAYVLATALFVGGAGLVGYFGYLYAVIPKPTVFPILVFIGLEITAQSFHATPKRHYGALALACVPALAALALIYTDKVMGAVGAMQLIDPNSGQAAVISPQAIGGPLGEELLTVRMLANGFILTSLLWSSALVALIDRRLKLAAGYFVMAAICALFGFIHSPMNGGPIFVPWDLPTDTGWLVYRFAAGYACSALLLFVWSFFVNTGQVSDDPPGLRVQA
jgi:AGZA family xanthine/uracil permease-like MFS transporter